MSPGLAPPYPWWRRGNLYFVNTSGSTPPFRHSAPARDSKHMPTPPRRPPPSPHPPSLPRLDHFEPSLAPLPPSELRPLIPLPRRRSAQACCPFGVLPCRPLTSLARLPPPDYPLPPPSLAGATVLIMPSLFVHLPRSPPSRRPRWPPRLTQSATFPTRPVLLARKRLPPPRLQPRLRSRLVAPRLASK